MIKENSYHLVRYSVKDVYLYGKSSASIFKYKHLPKDIDKTHEIYKNKGGEWIEWNPIEWNPLKSEQSKVIIEKIDWSLDLYGRFDGLMRMTTNCNNKNTRWEFIYYWGA
jgi:hypothetical protein